MRKYLPPVEYRLLKNRKTARLCREKRRNQKSEIGSKIEEISSTAKSLEEQLS